MKKTLIGLLGIVAVVAMLGSCGKPKAIVFASDCTYPPMEYMNLDTNKPEGFDIDMVAAIAKAGGFDYEVKNTAWNGIFAGLLAGSYDAIVSSLNITDDRKKTMDFSDPYLNAGQSIVVPAGKGSPTTTLNDFVGKKVGVQISTTAQDSVDAIGGVDVHKYDAIGLAFEDLANGRLDAVVVDEPIAGDYALKKDQYKGKFELAGQPFEGADFAMAVKKGNKRVLDLIDKGLAAIKADGTLDALKAKWFK